MKGAIIAMKSTDSEVYSGPRLSRDRQRQRLLRVIDAELTARQREIITAYYLENRSMTEIARTHGINKSTVCRTLQRAEKRMRRCLRY